ncbi:MAG: hypothetical protein R3B68_03395 [Phycisphaerales bacterium]
MGLLQSLGRLWNGSGRTRNASTMTTDTARRPVSIDLHTRNAASVNDIDDELTARLGLEPAPLPKRPAAAPRAAQTPAPRPGTGPVTGDVLDPVGVVASASPEPVEAIPLEDADEAPAIPHPVGEHRHNGNIVSALLAFPGEARGRLRSRQQVLDQLKENYEEVIRVVRKVDSQLDQQTRRGERMLEVAEHTAHGRLPEIREETRKVGDAIERLAAGIGRGHDRLEQGVADQVAAIERVQGLLTQLVEADRSLGESLVEFRRTATGMATATERLGSALAGLQDRSARRDEQLAELIDRSQKTTTTVMVLSVVCVGAAVTMAVLAML